MKKLLATTAVLAALICPAWAGTPTLSACDSAEAIASAIHALENGGFAAMDITNIADEGSTDLLRRCSGIATFKNSVRSIVDYTMKPTHGGSVTNTHAQVYGNGVRPYPF
jgi:hypothetical protein